MYLSSKVSNVHAVKHKVAQSHQVRGGCRPSGGIHCWGCTYCWSKWGTRLYCLLCKCSFFHYENSYQLKFQIWINIKIQVLTSTAGGRNGSVATESAPLPTQSFQHSSRDKLFKSILFDKIQIKMIIIPK